MLTRGQVVGGCLARGLGWGAVAGPVVGAGYGALVQMGYAWASPHPADGFAVLYAVMMAMWGGLVGLALGTWCGAAVGLGVGLGAQPGPAAGTWTVARGAVAGGLAAAALPILTFAAGELARTDATAAASDVWIVYAPALLAAGWTAWGARLLTHRVEGRRGVRRPPPAR